MTVKELRQALELLEEKGYKHFSVALSGSSLVVEDAKKKDDHLVITPVKRIAWPK